MTTAVKIGPHDPVSPEQRELIEGMAIAYLGDNPPRPSPYSIAKAIGVNYQTFYRLMDQYKGFGDRIRAAIAIAERAAVDEVQDCHFDLANGRAPRFASVVAQIHILKHHRKNRYGDRYVGFGSGIQVNIDKAQINLAGQTTDEMRQIEAPDSEGE